ncbi:MAG TPA: ribonuclease HI family protein [Gemmataceae bacterium]|jgi:ribonuclease HI|nr:ribonuclease HI family protein [Gemmataceae bacterium]
MTTTPEYLIHTDGGSRGNPGPAAYAYTIECPGQPAIEEKGYLGETTNNIAEYTGLIRALEHAMKLGARRVLVHSDSELIINQMNGAYKVKHPGLLPLYKEADELRHAFDHVTLRHVRREHNKRTDRLCNEALDAAAGRAPAASTYSPKLTKNSPAPAAPEDPNRRDLERLVRDDVLTCLRASAAAWARDKDGKLQAEHVWEQIWSILIEAGVLKKRKG